MKSNFIVKLFSLSFVSLLFLFLGEGVVLARKDCNKLFPQPWQFPDRQRCHGENNAAGLAEESWGEAGRAIYQGAASIMSKRYPTGVPLNPLLKNALRPHFGGLVDRVTIHWGTPLLDTWANSRYGIRLTSTDSAGQTFGYDIYIAQQEPRGKYSPNLVHLIIHELTHSAQYERYGSSLSNFGYHYFKKYKQAGQSYANNQLEREAEETANRIDGEVYASYDVMYAPSVENPSETQIRREAERREAERREAERRETLRREAERREAQRIEAQRRQAERREAQRIEAERIEAERRAREAEKIKQQERHLDMIYDLWESLWE